MSQTKFEYQLSEQVQSTFLYSVMSEVPKKGAWTFQFGSLVPE